MSPAQTSLPSAGSQPSHTSVTMNHWKPPSYGRVCHTAISWQRPTGAPSYRHVPRPASLLEQLTSDTHGSACLGISPRLDVAASLRGPLAFHASAVTTILITWTSSIHSNRARSEPVTRLPFPPFFSLEYFKASPTASHCVVLSHFDN